MAPESPDPLRDAAPAYDDLEARRARAGVAAALFGDADDEPEPILVGRYRVESRLGAGGMGVVYRAHDPDLDRPVAVKLLHTDAAGDDKARARMLREARALAKLSHPNVITVYDVGVEDGQVFVAMELVAGKELRRWLEGRRAEDWRAILEVFLAAGRGLEAAHAVGLVHRDFKPENVLVGDDGRVRVLDFGLARSRTAIGIATHGDGDGDGVGRGEPGARSDGDRVAEPAADLVATNESNLDAMPTHEVERPVLTRLTGHLTETGALIGTPLYMAPELYAGEAADAASDQFAFCASLYEGLYGGRPFGEDTLTAHVDAVVVGRVVEPPASSPVPRALWRLIAKGLDPKPLARHRDMSTLLAALEAVVAERAATSPSSPPATSSTWRWLVGIAVVVLAVAGLVAVELGLLGPRQLPAPEQPNLDVAPSQGDRGDRGGDRGGDLGEDPPTEATTTGSPALADDTSTTGEDGPAATGEDGDGSDSSSDSSSDEGETGPEVPATDGAAASDPIDLDGWCHLHEDRYTLLSRSPRRRATLVDQGTCYVCRVERRRSRTRNFSPRDCAGYSLCGPSSPEDCR